MGGVGGSSTFLLSKFGFFFQPDRLGFLPCAWLGPCWVGPPSYPWHNQPLSWEWTTWGMKPVSLQGKVLCNIRSALAPSLSSLWGMGNGPGRQVGGSDLGVCDGSASSCSLRMAFHLARASFSCGRKDPWVTCPGWSGRNCCRGRARSSGVSETWVRILILLDSHHVALGQLLSF